jgi:beta-glucanase (GH16 family)
VQPGSILFEDDFTGPAGPYDHTKWGEWSTATYNGSAAYGNIQPGDRATIDGQGHLVVPATPTQGTSISTAGKYAFTYGEFSAWIKNPTQVGYWPAFWTLNNDPHGVDHPLIGEADVIEGYTTWAAGYHAGVHNWNNQDSSLTWSTPGDPVLAGDTDLTAGFHKYTARIEPGKVTMLFDGQVVRTTLSTDGGGKPWGFGPTVTAGNWLILTLAIGGAGGAQQPATAPASMLVDRVEVRAL